MAIFEQQANNLQYQETNIFYGFVEIEEDNIYFYEVNTKQRRPLIVEESFKRKRSFNRWHSSTSTSKNSRRSSISKVLLSYR